MNTTKSIDSIFEQQKKSIGFWEEMAITEFTESVLEQLELKNISKAELAERMNVSPAYITKLIGGSNNLTLRTMARIAWALGSEFRCHLKPERERTLIEAVAKLRAVWKDTEWSKMEDPLAVLREMRED